LKGGAEAASDDIWALHATLYTALTGKLPFLATERDALRKQMMASRPKPLSEHGLDERALAEIVARGLVGERRLRVAELGELSQSLDGWERDPRALPPRRAPAPRPTARGVGDLLGNPNAGSLNDGIVIDASVLSVVAAAPPRLPAASMPVVAAPPPLPAVSAPPPLPAVSAPPPLPAVAVTAPPLPSAAVAVPPLPAAALPPPAAPPAALPPLPPLPPEPAWTPAPQASLDQLVAQLPKPAPFPAVVAPVRAPVKRRLSFNPFEKKRKLWPIVVGAAAMGGLGVYVALGGGGSAAPPPAPSAVVPAAAPKPRVAEKPKLSPAETREICVRSHFPDRAFQAGTEFAFVCEEGDFRELSRRLFSVVKQQPPAAGEGEPKAPGAAAVGLGWYELPAAAIIRKSCCVAATAVVLPETVGWCEQLQSAVRRIADDSDKAGDGAPGARAFDKAVTCLYVHRINRPYSFTGPPSEPQRREFQRFLSLAAISNARR
jgi:hypothetical protein